MTKESELSNEELVKLYLETKDPKYFTQLEINNRGILWMVVNKLTARTSNAFHTGEDLYSLAILGMYDTFSRFDPEYGVKFSSFLVSSVYLYLINCIKDESTVFKIPRNKYSKYFQLLEYNRDDLSDKERQLVDEVGRARAPHSLDTYYRETGDNEATDESLGLIDPFDLEAEAEIKFVMEDIDEILTNEFSPIDKDIILKYYLEGMSLRKLGTRHNMTREGIRQRKIKAMSSLKIKMQKKGYSAAV